MRTRIAKEFRFEAAHHLPNHNGKCRNLHGHNYRVRVVVEGDPVDPDGKSSDEGMVVDFAELSSIWKNNLAPYLDHAEEILNTVVPVPTAERLAAWIFGTFAKSLSLNWEEGKVVELTVWETDDSSATVYG